MLSLSIPRRASESEELLNRYWWSLLLVTNAVDVLASKRAFASGIAELNPAVDLVISHFGVWALAVSKAIWLVMLLLLLPYIRGWTQALLALSCLVYCGVVLAHIWYLSPLL